MDMDMDMSTENTPPNGNEMYTQILMGIICAILFLLITRYYVLIRPWTQLSNKKTKKNQIKWYHSFTKLPQFNRYTLLDRYIVNKCSFSFPFLPPIGFLLLVIVLITALLPLLIMNNDLALNSNRAGFLTISLVPFLLASTGHYSPLALLTGMQPSTLNQFHRLLGWAIMILATVHMSCMLYAWAKFPFFMQSQLQVIKVQYGLAGYGCLCVVVLGSLYPVRVFKYEFFLFTHLLAFGFIGAISKHTPYALRYFMTGIVCYTINVLTSWFIQSRLARARLHVLDHGCTRISLRVSSPIYHSPGQYIYLCIPKISPFQWHPFTITSTEQIGQSSSSKNTMIEVHACVRGDFTKKLYQLASNPSSTNDHEWNVFIGGPCGRNLYLSYPEHMLQHQKVIVLSTAGAGVTFGIRLMRELATYLLDLSNGDDDSTDNNDRLDEEKENVYLKNKIITHDIYFNWSVRNKGELKWFENELNYYKNTFDKLHQLYPSFPTLHILFYHTNDKGSSSEETIETNGDSSQSHSSYEIDEDIISTTVQLKNEKNQMIEMDQHQQKKKSSIIYNKRINPKEWLSFTMNHETMALYVCGSSSFNRSFKNAVASLKHSQSRLVDFHCEDFEY
ncbi:unnamed protein product [Cunninghamella blakesleeana]